MVQMSETEARSLSNWQLSRVRNALRTYHSLQSNFDWKDVREAIAVYTEYEVGGPGPKGQKNGVNILLAFVEGIPHRKTGARHHQTPKAETLVKIIEFVTDEELNLLTEEEFFDKGPLPHAAIRLLEYVGDGLESEHAYPMLKFECDYSHISNDTERFAVRTLMIRPTKIDGILQVAHRQEVFPLQHFQSYKTWSAVQRRKYRSASVNHSGWAVLSPDGNLMFFMKHDDNNSNLHYHAVQSSGDRSESDTPFKALALIELAFPITASHKTADSKWDVHGEGVAKDAVSSNVREYIRIGRIIRLPNVGNREDEGDDLEALPMSDTEI